LVSKLLNTQQLADYLGVKPTTIRRKAAKGEIPHIRIQNRLRFDQQEIDKWLQDNSRGLKTQILVVDDDPIIGQFFTKILEPYKEFQVTVASSGQEALAVFSSQRFDMLFLDLVMPGMDGVEVLKNLRQLSPQIPVAIITGYPDSNLLVKAGQYSPCLSIFKPFTPSQIIGAVKSIQASIAASVSSIGVD
jgi:excisionase family DNA binding protein